MNKYFSKIIWLIIFLSPIIKAKAQETILAYFNASEMHEEVLLKWAVLEGETCNGILITRSTDSLFFEAIGEISGVCGDPNFQQPYNFIDKTPPKNTKVYYKLELGVSDFSNIISIELISKNESGYQVRPQPMQNKGKIYFDNHENKEWGIDIYQMNGQIIYQSITQKNYFELFTENWSGGVYIFNLSSSEKIIRGKIIITK